MKNFKYILLFIISVFLFSMSVNAQEIDADNQWHDVEMSPFTVSSGSTAFCSSSSNSVNRPVYVKAVKNSDGSYSCKVRAEKSGNISIEYGELDSIGGQIIKNSVTVHANKVQKSNSSGEDLSYGDSSSVSEEDVAFLQVCNVQENPQIVASFRLIGIFLTIAKIIVPIILIVMGSIDMSKAVINGNSDAVTKQLKVLIQRIILGILVFLAPTLVLETFHTVDGFDDIESKYSVCMDCLMGSNKCPEVNFIK